MTIHRTMAADIKCSQSDWTIPPGAAGMSRPTSLNPCWFRESATEGLFEGRLSHVPEEPAGGDEHESIVAEMEPATTAWYGSKKVRRARRNLVGIVASADPIF